MNAQLLVGIGLAVGGAGGTFIAPVFGLPSTLGVLIGAVAGGVIAYGWTRGQSSRSHPEPEGRGQHHSSAGPTEQLRVRVLLYGHEKVDDSNSEVVTVPLGTTITVSRRRTVERELRLGSSDRTDWAAGGGIHGLVTASVHRELERTHGQSFKVAEAKEYSITLSGEHATRYKLVWSDLWQLGSVAYIENGELHLVPFRFHESTELIVRPFDQNKRSDA